MPMAVMTESSEKTMSSTITWPMTLANDAAALARPVLAALELVVNLVGRLGEQEQAAADQDQVAAGDVPPEDVNSGSVSRAIQVIENSSASAHHHRGDQADAARALLLLLRQLGRQDRDEDDVVDPENDLQERQRDERDGQFGHGERLVFHNCGSRPPAQAGLQHRGQRPRPTAIRRHAELDSLECSGQQAGRVGDGETHAAQVALRRDTGNRPRKTRSSNPHLPVVRPRQFTAVTRTRPVQLDRDDTSQPPGQPLMIAIGSRGDDHRTGVRGIGDRIAQPVGMCAG